MNTHKYFPVSFVLIKKDKVLLDVEVIDKENKLGRLNNNGRKILALNVKKEFGEELINAPVWKAPQILPTGEGGIEISTFTEYSKQDRHKHLKGTEIYTVLKGTMEIFINDEPYILNELDEVVILPGTVHEVAQQNSGERKNIDSFELVVRVHSINCFGESDKYVQLEQDGKWESWENLSNEKRKRTYKKSIL